MNSTKIKPLSKKTVDALLAVADSILINHAHYTQGEYCKDFGTAAERGCIAFHYAKLFLSPRSVRKLVKAAANWSIWDDTDNPFYTAASTRMKLPLDGGYRLLGSINRWPEKFYTAYRDAATSKGRARACVNFIKFFIKTNGTCVTN